MAVKSVALYWDLTGDPYAMEFLRRLAPYFPNVQHRSELSTDAEMPQLKHYLYNFVNPAVPAMLACLLQDGANRQAADVAAPLEADNVDNVRPSFLSQGQSYAWYNYNATTFAAACAAACAAASAPQGGDAARAAGVSRSQLPGRPLALGRFHRRRGYAADERQPGRRLPGRPGRADVPLGGRGRRRVFRGLPGAATARTPRPPPLEERVPLRGVVAHGRIRLGPRLGLGELPHPALRGLLG